jgi:putative oxidoreductase
MLANLRKTQVDLAALVLRLGLAAVFITHGWIKISQTDSWTEVIPRQTQIVVGWTEFVCGCALLIGLLSRLAALGIGAIMVGAVYYYFHLYYFPTGGADFIETNVGRHGFNFRVVGWEYNFVLIAMALAVLILGGGFLSVDHLIFGRWARGRTVSTAPAGTPPGMVVSQR